jgi:hypothetical protein
MPAVMESLLGKMFIGYKGMPVFNKPCDFRGCQHRQNPIATMEYWFPRWFMSMNMKLHLKYLPREGPQLQLATIRRIPDSSQSITFAMKGDIEGLKYLFSQGLALPTDVSDSRGFSLVRVSFFRLLHIWILKLWVVGALWRYASVRNGTVLAQSGGTCG